SANLAVADNRGGIIDRFRNRLIFPIISVQKKVIAFGGRIFGDGKPKYLNSSDTPVFTKGRQLFALNLAKSSKQKGILLAEGYMDVIALHQSGFDNAVASLGTSLTDKQAELLGRYSGGDVTIVYDSDTAGRAASERAAAILNKSDIKVSILSLDGAKDPDDFLQLYGAAALRLRLDERESHMTFKLTGLSQEFDIQTDEGRVEFLKRAAEVLSAVNNEVEREVYIARAADMAGGGKDAVALGGKKIRGGASRKAGFKEERSAIRASVRKPKHIHAEEEFISQAINEPDLAKSITPLLKVSDFESPVCKKLWERVLSGAQSNLSFSQDLTDDEMRIVSKAQMLPKSQENMEKSLRECHEIIIRQSMIRASDNPVERAMPDANKMKRYGESE
ncbi:MAG: toprim domain-containing protein, partial [Oscillospiraceae bacterium]|nr:toprim domain-containing protein [Oscillospiraceae bacterium]